MEINTLKTSSVCSVQRTWSSQDLSRDRKGETVCPEWEAVLNKGVAPWPMSTF